jgi:cyclophilin family peptidyl-prolyl cis-trans isomerase
MKKSLFVVALLSLATLFLINKYYFPPKIIFQKSDFAEYVVISTSEGEINIKLNSKESLAIAQFVRLTRNGFYDGLRFHHIVPDLLIQVGDPLTKYEQAKQYWGQGGMSSTFPLETGRTDQMTTGTVAMADTGTRSYGSQFFILTKDSPWMKGRATIVGNVSDGMEVVKKIESLPIDVSGKPKSDVFIIKMTTR